MSTAAKPDLKTYQGRMDKAVSALKEEFGGLRTGRASSGLLEPIHVEAYGSTVPINQVGAISVPEHTAPSLFAMPTAKLCALTESALPPWTSFVCSLESSPITPEHATTLLIATKPKAWRSLFIRIGNFRAGWIQ